MLNLPHLASSLNKQPEDRSASTDGGKVQQFDPSAGTARDGTEVQHPEEGPRPRMQCTKICDMRIPAASCGNDGDQFVVFAGTACGRICSFNSPAGVEMNIEKRPFSEVDSARTMQVAACPFPQKGRVVNLWPFSRPLAATGCDETGGEIKHFLVAAAASAIAVYEIRVGDGEPSVSNPGGDPSTLSLLWQQPQLKVQACCLVECVNVESQGKPALVFVFGDDQGRMRFFEYSTGAQLFEQGNAHAGKILSLHRDKSRAGSFYSLGADSTVAQWRVSCRNEFIVSDSSTTASSSSADGKRNPVFSLEKVFWYKSSQISHLYFHDAAGGSCVEGEQEQKEPLLAGFTAGDFVMVSGYQGDELVKVNCGGARRAFCISSEEFVYTQQDAVYVKKIPKVNTFSQKLLNAGVGKEVLALACPRRSMIARSSSATSQNSNPSEEDVLFSGGEENVLAVHTFRESGESDYGAEQREEHVFHSEQNSVKPMSFSSCDTEIFHRQASAVKCMCCAEQQQTESSSNGGRRSFLVTGSAHGELKVFDATAAPYTLKFHKVLAQDRLLAIDARVDGENLLRFATTTSSGVVLFGTLFLTGTTARLGRLSRLEIPGTGVGMAVALLRQPTMRKNMDEDGGIVKMHQTARRVEPQVELHEAGQPAASFAVGCTDGGVYLFDGRMNKWDRDSFKFLPGSVNAVCAVTIMKAEAPENSTENQTPLIAAACDDGMCYILRPFFEKQDGDVFAHATNKAAWPEQPAVEIANTRGHISACALKCVAYDEPRQLLVTAGWDRVVRVYCCREMLQSYRCSSSSATVGKAHNRSSSVKPLTLVASSRTSVTEIQALCILESRRDDAGTTSVVVAGRGMEKLKIIVEIVPNSCDATEKQAKTTQRVADATACGAAGGA
ncbi:unnamed protein product [Amoebophrya sp. A120]|nr:unnamed protein product [Amoebophrya sp. A120]|eukprot:GSA120T00018904001.1